MNKFDFQKGVIFENALDITKPKNWILGLFTSFMPGFTKDEKEKQDPFAAAQAQYAESFRKEREDELKAKIKHKVTMRVLAYKKAKEAQLGELKAKNKIEAYKRKQEEDAENEVLKQLKEQTKKIDAWSGGPMTQEVMLYRCSVINQIYKDATPAERQLADNWVGATYNFVKEHTNKDGEFVASDEDWEELSKNPAFQDPAIQTQLKKARQLRDKNPKALLNYLAKEAQLPEFQTPEEIQGKIDTLSQLQNTIAEQEQTINDEQQKLTKLEETGTKITENLESAKKHVNTLKAWENVGKIDSTKPQEAAQKITQHLFSNPPQPWHDGLVVPGKEDDPEHKEPSLNAKVLKEHPEIDEWIKNVSKATGLPVEDIKSKLVSGTNPPPPPTKEKLEQELQAAYDASMENMSDSDKEKQYKKAISFREQNIKEATNGLAALDVEYEVKKDNDGNPTGEYEVKLDDYETKQNNLLEENKKQQNTCKSKISGAQDEINNQLKNHASEIRDTLGKPNDGSAITTQDLQDAQASLEIQKSEQGKTEQKLAELGKAAKEAETNKQGESKMAGVIKNNPELEEKISKLQPGDSGVAGKPNLIVKKDEKGEYVIYKDKDGVRHKVYKPTDKGDTEAVEKWNAAYVGASAMMKIGPKPKLQYDADGNPTPDSILELKAWELNRKNRDAARVDWKNDEDYEEARNGEYDDDVMGETSELSDAEKQELNDLKAKPESELSDEQKKRLKELQDKSEGGEEDVNDEDSGLEDTKLTDKEQNRLNELKSKKKDDLSEEEQKELEKLQALTGENEDDLNDNSSLKNPAKTWKRRRNKSTGKTTKNYYYRGPKKGMQGASISPKEYKKKMDAFKERRKKQESLFDNNKPIIFEKHSWMMTPLSKYKK